ncbi:MAG: 4-hydroxy-tetrahydrodipicolinate reductase [Bacillota bacterium]|nr:4-hydroxy-tetrahydrodipicolinate reductase [Bacillota bacterium]
MKVAIMGKGAMGHVLSDMVEAKDGLQLAGAVEPLNGEKLEDLGQVDVVIDFSHPANLPAVAEFCKKNNVPAVLATTAYGDKEMEILRELATHVPVVFSSNYSLGINVIKRVLSEITPILESAFDIEIVEKHHNKKLDSPSGTAMMLLNAVDPEGEYDHVFGREGNRKRGKEIGVHAIRGGTIAGEHEVLFAGTDEIISIKHNADSKKIFAAGALKAAEFVQKAETGYYTMEDVLFG